MKNRSYLILCAAVAFAAVGCEGNQITPEPTGDSVKVTLSQKEVSLLKSETVTLTCAAEGLAPGAEIFWRSMNSDIVKVDKGVITPVSGGKTRVIAGWHQFRDTCYVNVVAPLTGIALSVEERELKLGKTFKLKAEPLPFDSTDPWDLKWSSSNPSVATVDANGVQINGWVNDVMRIEPISDKWKAFGWQVVECAGNNMREVLHALHTAKTMRAPAVILMRTVKGRGVSFMEDDSLWHGKAPSEEQLLQAIAEVEKGGIL